MFDKFIEHCKESVIAINILDRETDTELDSNVFLTKGAVYIMLLALIVAPRIVQWLFSFSEMG